jgi:branched-chain amino acid transport system substrate-binding protein
VKKYQEKYNVMPDALAALAYDATNMLLQAIKDAGADDPAKVKDTLAKGQFEVVSGKITFDAFHTPVKPVFVNVVKDDAVQFFTQITP